MMSARLCGALVLVTSGKDGLPDPLPSTFEFIDRNYQGHRFEGQQALVFGGTSGMGFATAARLVQECAVRTVVVGRAEKKGQLAAQVIQQRTSQAHCAQQGVIEYLHADITQRDQVRSVFDSFHASNDGKLQVVVQTAATVGWTGDFANLPDNILFTGRDAIYNNLYGTKAVTQEALRFWNMTGCTPTSGQQCPKLDYLPSLVIFSSQNGMNPTPNGESYGISKHGLIGLTTSIAAAFPGQLRANVVLPGLIDTPFTWNQFRGYEMLPNGSAVVKYPNLQTSWQCVVDGQIVENGECSGGGTGYGCPCEDIRKDDPRVSEALVGSAVWPLIDPRHIADAVLQLSDHHSNLTGVSRVVGKETYQCDEAGSYPDEAKLKPLWEFCPQLKNSVALV